MSNNRVEKHAYVNVGPGGMNCPCCAPPPGEDRVRLFRVAKKRSRRVVQNEIDAALLDMENDKKTEAELEAEREEYVRLLPHTD